MRIEQLVASAVGMVGDRVLGLVVSLWSRGTEVRKRKSINNWKCGINETGTKG
jgi:hypothetical protein